MSLGVENVKTLEKIDADILLSMVHKIPCVVRGIAVFPVPAGLIARSVDLVSENISNSTVLLAAIEIVLVADSRPVEVLAVIDHGRQSGFQLSCREGQERDLHGFQ